MKSFSLSGKATFLLIEELNVANLEVTCKTIWHSKINGIYQKPDLLWLDDLVGAFSLKKFFKQNLCTILSLKTVSDHSSENAFTFFLYMY